MKRMILNTMIVVCFLLITNWIRAQEQSKEQELADMLYKGKNPDTALELAQKIDSANWGEKYKVSLLLYAAEKGYNEVCKVLIDKGANIDYQIINGGTALIVATAKGHSETVKLLLDHGANTDLQINSGENALIIASALGNKEIVKLLLDKGAKLDLQVPAGPTALIIASVRGYTEIVKLLLEKGADTEITTIEGKTAYDYTTNDEIKILLSNNKKRNNFSCI